MDEAGNAAILTIRLVNAILWTLVSFEILRHDQPVPRLVRQLITTVIIFGMWVLVLGGLAPFGFPGEVARSVYTVFTAYAALIALGILTTGDDQEGDLPHPQDH